MNESLDKKMHWENIYKTKEPTDVSWYQPESRISLNLIRQAGMSTTAQIIDVGGGASRLVDSLIEQGFQYMSVLDISSSALHHARERLGALAEQVTWIEADVTCAMLPAAHYDLWHDRAVFHFLTNAVDRDHYIQTMQYAVKPSGHIIIATFALDGPTKCSGLDVVQYSPESLQITLGPEFELIGSLNEIHRTPFGTEQRFVYSHFVRR